MRTVPWDLEIYSRIRGPEERRLAPLARISSHTQKRIQEENRTPASVHLRPVTLSRGNPLEIDRI